MKSIIANPVASRSLKAGLMAACLCAASVPVIASPSPSVTPDGRKSGFEYMSDATQAMQRHDAENPAFLWVAQGKAKFEEDCARCHAEAKLASAATRYPAYDERLKQPVTLNARINLCRTRHVRQMPYPPDHGEQLALASYLGHLARGKAIEPVTDPRLKSALDEGAKLYRQKFGQLAMSCAMCHDGVPGKRLAGSTIPQAHPTAYPIYRLEWQGMGSLERRIRGCMTGVRAEPYGFGSRELTALELYLTNRASGMMIETPGVRP